MSVLPVRKISLAFFTSDADAIMQSLQTAGVLHLEEHGDTLINQDLARATAACEKKLHRLHSATTFIKRFQAIPSAIPLKSLSAESLFERVYAMSEECARIDERIDDIKALLARYTPFGEFVEDDASLRAIGYQLKLATVDEENVADINPSVAYHMLGRSGSHFLYAFLCTLDDNIGVETFALPPCSMSALRTELTDLQTHAFALKEEAARWAYQLRKLDTLVEKTEERRDRLVELHKARHTGKLIGIQAYVLAHDVDKLKQSLQPHVIAMTIDTPTTDDNVPVMLKNLRPWRGFEALIKAFTGITYFERDKTVLVFLLFTFFGGLCLLDAGYGFLLFIAGYIVALKKNRDFGHVFMWTGAFATILGTLCGHVFGLTFAKDIMLTTPAILPLTTDAKSCLEFSLLVGAGAMALANLVAMYQSKLKTHATGNFMIIVGAFTLVLKESELLLGQFYDPSFVLDIVAISCFSLGALWWLIFPDVAFGETKPIANRLWTLYAAPLGLVHDVLSHIRLFVIALAGSLLALAINKICATIPTPFGMLFAPVGHLMVFLISVLALYIHTNRLIFLEFGTKCMSGGTTYFKPFSRRN